MKDRLAEATPRREKLGMDSGWVYRFSRIKKLKASIRYGRYHCRDNLRFFAKINDGRRI